MRPRYPHEDPLGDTLDDLLGPIEDRDRAADFFPATSGWPLPSSCLMAEQACASSPGVPRGEHPATSPGLSSPPGPGCGRGVSLPQDQAA